MLATEARRLGAGHGYSCRRLSAADYESMTAAPALELGEGRDRRMPGLTGLSV